MLTDQTAIAIAAKARQAGIRCPDRSRAPFHAIFRDFLDETTFAGRRCVDLGPGHFDFAVLVQDRGGISFGLDHDPAVVALGRHLGFPVAPFALETLQGRDRLAALGFPDRFDGVFCKYSVNAYWFRDPEAVRDHVRALCALRSDDGWGWIAPWNGVKSADLPGYAVEDGLKRELAEAQIAAFVENGWSAFALTEAQCERYGVSGATFNRPLFTCNLEATDHLAPMAPGAARTDAIG